jgi:hypothetical protein
MLHSSKVLNSAEGIKKWGISGPTYADSPRENHSLKIIYGSDASAPGGRGMSLPRPTGPSQRFDASRIR